jgi:hypothetical protein
MESHPEEFRVADGPERWVTHIDMVQDYGSEADKAALNAKLRDIVMGEVHEDVMDELLNGEDRRRKEKEEQEYERNLKKSLTLTQHQMMQQAQGSLQNAYANAFTNQAGAYDADLDMYRNTTGTLPIANGGTAATTGTLTNTIKQLLGAKK